MKNHAIELPEQGVSREEVHLSLKPSPKYDKKTNEAIEYLKELSIKRIAELEKALKILKCRNACL